jgi:hypothetical protein
MKNLSQDTWSPNRDLNPGPSKYEAGVLTTRPQCSEYFLYLGFLTQHLWSSETIIYVDNLQNDFRWQQSTKKII